MELHEREFFVGRLCLPYSKISVAENVDVFVHPLSVEEYFEAQEVYKQSFKDAIKAGNLHGEDFEEFLIRNSIWNNILQDELDELVEKIEDCKVGIYDSYFQSSVQEVYRKELEEHKKRNLELLSSKHSYDYINCDGLASYARWNWLIQKSTKYEDGSPYDWKHATIQKVLTKYRDSILSEEYLRILARTDPWTTIWSYTDGRPFDNENPLEYTHDQKQIIIWTKFYSNIQEAMDYPPQEIVDDNDALDGWLIKKRREKEREREGSLADELNNKHEGADEVFVYAPSSRDKAKVDRLNDAGAAHVKQQRLSQLEQQGEVKYGGFKDVQMRKVDQSMNQQKGR